MQVPCVELDNLPDERAVEPRANKDLRNRGREMLAMCAAEDLLIFNGRTRGDLVGNCTFHRNASCTTVDYFMASCALFQQAVSMTVMNDKLALCSFESDHYPIELQLLATKPTRSQETTAGGQRIKWDSSRK